MVLFGFIKPHLLNHIERIFYWTICYFPITFPIIIIFPFSGIGVLLEFYTHLIGDQSFILYHDNKLRIEQPYIRFIGPDPKPVIYVKEEFTCYHDTSLKFGYNDMHDHITVAVTND